MARRTRTILGSALAVLLFAAQGALASADSPWAAPVPTRCAETMTATVIPVPGQNPAFDAARDYYAEMVAAGALADLLTASIVRVATPSLEGVTPLLGHPR